MKKIIATIAIIERDGKYLIAQRKPEDHWGLYWEFPGGKCEEGESLEECVVREIQEELGITIRVRERGETLVAETPDRRILLHSFFCSVRSGEPRAIECHDFRWVWAQELTKYRFPPANEKLIERLQRMKSAS